MITLGQVGLGYWGPNVLRNFAGLQQVCMKACCDLDEAASSGSQCRTQES